MLTKAYYKVTHFQPNWQQFAHKKKAAKTIMLFLQVWLIGNK